MAFRVPDFNILCNIWHAMTIPPVGVPDLGNQICQLTWDTTGSIVVGTSIMTANHAMLLKVPKGTDLRGRLSTTGVDVIEVPAGTARYYGCVVVDDVGKGFANEYRQGVIFLEMCPTPLP